MNTPPITREMIIEAFKTGQLKLPRLNTTPVLVECGTYTGDDYLADMCRSFSRRAQRPS